MRTWTGFALLVIVGVLLQACSALPRLDPVPPAQTELAQIAGIPDARYWLDRDLGPFIRSVIGDNQRERDALAQSGRAADPLPPINFLAISGGGDAGAFAAGILSGWTARGDRPAFKVVTGISAGALIAPFAFLGPQYDEVIVNVATAIGPNDVFHQRNVLVGLAKDGMADSEPLARIVAKYVTPEILAAVAREFAKGRVLEIGTTDLDAGRPVTWNMGAIAASKEPGALELFRKIMIASTSIPGAVSPVMFDVVAGGKHFQEMHVDGGVITQVFTYPPSTVMELLRATGKPLDRDLRIFVIRNGKLEPEWSATERRTLSIGGRAINALVQMQGTNDLYRIYTTAKRDGADFNLAYIGSDFTYPHPHQFDTDYMKHLYAYAYSLGATGNAWHKAPPNESPSAN
jgi:predicted acylesterase/phospholipase RssA